MRFTAIALLFSTLLFACGNSSKETPEEYAVRVSKENIANLEQVVFGNMENGLDIDNARRLMSAYLDFSNMHRQDEMAPEYMFKAAEIAMNLSNFTQAANILENLRDGFPTWKKAPDVANWIAFVYDFQIVNKDKARDAYNDIIERWPDHKYATDARARLETLHMTDEEWLEWAAAQNADEEPLP
jgi:outer membrane protein assembly factor BamD (BamD/ComL family)